MIQLSKIAAHSGLCSVFKRAGMSPTACYAFRSLSSDGSSSGFMVEKLGGNREGIVVLRLNRPETKNAISRAMLTAFQDSVYELNGDRSVRSIIIKSDVAGAFCAGADLKERVLMRPEDVPRFVSAARRLMSDLELLHCPVIAAIDGFALGGGLEMAMSCDLRVASANAKVGLTEAKLGIIPGAGGTQRLPRLIGMAKAKELIYTGRMIDGSNAFKLGLVNDCVEQNDQGDAAYVRAVELAEEMLKCGPIALKMAKQAINLGMQTDINSAMKIEELCYAQVIPTKDRIEALKAFKEKRAPNFQGL